MKHLHYTLLLFVSVFVLNSNTFARVNPCISASTYKIVVLGSVTSTAGMTSYEWMDGSTNSSFEFIASQFGPGIHYVTVFAYDLLNCYHEDAVIVAVDDLVGMNELNSSKTAYPNPTTGSLNLSNPDIDYVEVFTLEGKKMAHLFPVNGSIDFSFLSDGFYLLSLSSQKGNKVIKVLKT